MRKILICLFLVIVATAVEAQIPYFPGTAGHGKLYSYTSLKMRPGINARETYTTFQYGVGDCIAAGADLYTIKGSTFAGVLFRAGKKVSKWFGIGGQITPSFDLKDSMDFSYLTMALYLNGAISADGNLFWCTNSWLRIKDGEEDISTNWEYLGYTFALRDGHSITPMVGAIHSWKFDEDIDMAAGLYYSFKKWNFYLWGNDFLKDHPRIVLGVDFAL